MSFFKAVTRIEEISVFNGKTIVSGWGLRGEGVSGPVLLRFNADGTFDNTLGGDGHVVADIGGFGRGAGHDVQIDGRVYVAVSASRANLTFGVMRLQDNGELDPGFGGGGVAYSNEPPSSGTPVDVLRQQDGALIVGGSLNNGGDLLMTRLTPGGAPDPSFGSNGTVLFDINSSFDSRPSYGLQGNRLIVAASTDGQLFLAAFQLQSNVSAEEDSFSADEDTPALLDVLANDTSPLGTTRTIFSFTQPSHGTLSRAGHATPVRPCRQLPWRGRVPLHRHRWPGQHRRRHVRLTVRSANDPPVAGPDAVTTEEGTGTLVNVLANDSSGPDIGEVLSVDAVQAPAHGSVIAFDGQFRYTPQAGFTGRHVHLHPGRRQRRTGAGHRDGDRHTDQRAGSRQRRCRRRERGARRDHCRPGQ